MATKSNIQWTDATWNIARGCTKVDSDCKFCYMYRDSMNDTRYNPMQVTKTKTVFNLPLKIKEPSKIFTCSLTDFFHEQCDSFRDEAWEIIRKCPQHTFQILTKRPERIIECLPNDWGDGWDNVWLGTSVGSQATSNRIWTLADQRIRTKTRFLSIEPLYGRLSPSLLAPALQLYDWIIIGGESGNETGKYKYRPCELEWFDTIISFCQVCKIPVFVKQMGTYLAKQMKMSDRHGGNIEEFPAQLQIRQFPK